MEGRRWIKHYNSSHKILLVGEGDFSFSVCLAKAFGTASSMVATSLDTKEMVMANHPTARTNLEKLEELKCTIVYSVNAHTMSQHPFLKKIMFNRVIFNFPHAGFTDFARTREHCCLQISFHQKLVKGFFRSARVMLAPKGEAHVTHKTAYPFSNWEVKKLAEDVGLYLVEEVQFSTLDYPGYINERGDGRKSNESFPVGKCSPFKFALPATADWKL